MGTANKKRMRVLNQRYCMTICMMYTKFRPVSPCSRYINDFPIFGNGGIFSATCATKTTNVLSDSVTYTISFIHVPLHHSSWQNYRLIYIFGIEGATSTKCMADHDLATLVYCLRWVDSTSDAGLSLRQTESGLCWYNNSIPLLELIHWQYSTLVIVAMLHIRYTGECRQLRSSDLVQYVVLPSTFAFIISSR